MDFAELRLKFQQHDWWYAFSDDQAVFLRGFGERRELIKGLLKCPPEQRAEFLACVPPGALLEFELEVEREMRPWKPLRLGP